MFRRRRPLLGAAMIGGTAYMGAKAGQRAAQNQAVEEQNEYDQNARLAQLESQQAPPPQAAPAAAPPGGDLTGKILELKGLMDQGILTPEEFASAKAKLLAG
jgi:predicted flap endonuclease-1-like 5' DNA nuclease